MKTHTHETFGSLHADHEDLIKTFLCHQRALLVKDISAAVGLAASFEAMLNRHIQFEEEVLLPLYASRGAEKTGGTLQIFHAEHEKLREGAATLTRHTRALSHSNDVLASLLALLDEESMFKGLLRHHALREENILFPALDESTSEIERKALLPKHAA